MNIPNDWTRRTAVIAGGLLAMGLTTLAPAQPPDQSEEEDLERSVPTEAILATDVVRIPFELKMNKIIVQVSVNGEGPFPFMFDSGAGGTVLDKAFAEALNLPVTGESELGDPSGSQRIPVDLVDIGEMSIGGLTVKGFQASSWDRSLHFPIPDPPKGIVGFPVFNDYLLTIDYEAKELVVAAGALSPADDHVIEFTAPTGIAELSCAVNGTDALTHIDTGAPHGVMVPMKFLDDDAIEGEPVVFGRARTVNSEFEIKGAQMKGAIEIAGHVIDDPFIMLNELFPAVNFGFDFLKHFRVTFDQVQGLVRFERISEEPLVLSKPQMQRHRMPGGG